MVAYWIHKQKRAGSASTNTEPPVVCPRSGYVSTEQGSADGAELAIDKSQVVSYNNS